MPPSTLPDSLYAYTPIKNIVRKSIRDTVLPLPINPFEKTYQNISKVQSLPKNKREWDEFILNSVDTKDFNGWIENFQKIDAFHKKNHVQAIFIWEDEYPPLLREIPDPPIVLFALGNTSILKQNWWAVVGTRKASPISRFATQILIRKHIHEGVGIVSGLALGIDREAMLAALEEGIPTMGVLGTSIDKEYPFQNRDLYKKMKSSTNTVLVTEYIPGIEYSKWTFPVRNRIITGVAEKVFIMESPSKSGALSSANSAIQQNRELWVFDHPLLYNNKGGQSLIEDGANLLSWEEIWPGSQIFSYSYSKEFWLSAISNLYKKNFCKNYHIPEEKLPFLTELEFLGLIQALVAEGMVISLGGGIFLWVHMESSS